MSDVIITLIHPGETEADDEKTEIFASENPVGRNEFQAAGVNGYKAKENDIREAMDNETWISGSDAPLYFNIEQTEPVEYAAAVGDYFNRAKNIPQELIKGAKNSAPNKPQPKTPDAEAVNRVLENKRAEIKRLIITSM